MIVGSDDYQFGLSVLAFNFNGGLTMDYLENQSISRIDELRDHSSRIRDKLDGQ